MQNEIEMEIYLTMDTLEMICKSECERHHVNFEYFMEKIVNTKPRPVTRNQLMEYLDEMLVNAFWNDYDGMYKGIGYPEYCIRKSGNLIRKKQVA
jgi:hypothetical protein